MSIDRPDNGPDDNSVSPSELRDQAQHDLGEATDHAKHDLGKVKERAAEDFRELGREATSKVNDATDKAKSFAGDQKDLAATQINGVAAAIEKVAQELENSDQPMVGRYARDLAKSISGLGNTIESRDVDDLMGLAQDFGRRQPVAFLGAAALAGFVASRFAVASAHRRDTPAPKAASVRDEQPGNDSSSASSFDAGGTDRTSTGGL